MGAGPDIHSESWKRMKKFLATAALVAAGIGGSTVATATASSLSTGKLKSFSYDSTTKVGKLKVTRNGATKVFRVTRASDCGYSTGQSGDQIPCRTLGKAKYDGKPVRVTWHRDDAGHRIVEVAAVDLS
jgi:hypothetical protein